MQSTFLLWHWRRLAEEVWKPLYELPKKAKAPDLFIQLARKTAEHLHQSIAASVVQDEELAYQWLCVFDASGHGCKEEDCAMLLEKWMEILKDLSPSPVKHFQRLIETYLRNNNIRYFFTGGKVGFRLTALLSERIEELRSLCIGDDELKEYYEKLEKRVSRMMYQLDDLEPIIIAGSHLLEKACKCEDGNFANAVNSLGKKIPHKALSACMCKLYGFMSDFPHLRHPGKKGGKLRSLNGNDMLAISSITLMFVLLIRSEDVPYSGHDLL